MPNWVFSSATFRGTKEAVHKLIKIGLVNSKLRSTGVLRQDFDLLVAEGKSLGLDEENHQIVLRKGLTARTFLPIPETFILYDTVNNPDKYPEAAKEQQEKYGAVGWYDYNILTLGTKWDFELINAELEKGVTCWKMHFPDIETAWDYPAQWFIAMKDLVPELNVDFTVFDYYEFEAENDDSQARTLYCYVENSNIVEGWSDVAIEEKRTIIEKDYRERENDLDATAVVLPVDADNSHPMVQEMLRKGFYIKDRLPLDDSGRSDTGVFCIFLKNKKTLYIDMDNVLVDFKSGLEEVDDATKQAYEGHLDDIPGLFALMEPMPGAIEAVHRLIKRYDCYILSTAPWENPSAWSDKVLWVQKYFGDVFYKRLILSHHKNLCHGDYLIDDCGKNGASEFNGWIQFGSPEFPDWGSILEYLNA